jgi:hypothetical protein
MGLGSEKRNRERFCGRPCSVGYRDQSAGQDDDASYEPLEILFASLEVSAMFGPEPSTQVATYLRRPEC